MKRAAAIAITTLALSGCGVQIVQERAGEPVDYANGYLVGLTQMQTEATDASQVCNTQVTSYLQKTGAVADQPVALLFEQGCDDAFAGKQPSQWPSNEPMPPGLNRP